MNSLLTDDQKLLVINLVINLFIKPSNTYYTKNVIKLLHKQLYFDYPEKHPTEDPWLFLHPFAVGRCGVVVVGGGVVVVVGGGGGGGGGEGGGWIM